LHVRRAARSRIERIQEVVIMMRTRALLPLVVGVLLVAAVGARAEEAPAEGLVLAVAVEPAEAESGTPVTLTATFHNRGTDTLEVFLPEHLPVVVFPRWTLVHEDGTVYLPHQPSFQSMWGRGLMGSILELAPGASKAFSRELTHVVRRVPDGRRSRANEAPVLLPAGRYTVHAAYEKKDDSVPMALPNFRQETRRHEGLWTGRVEAEGVPLHVAPSQKPTITITAPETAEPGASYPVRMEIRHAGSAAVPVRGALTLRAWSKAYGGGGVRILLRDDDHVPAPSADAVHEVTFVPGQTRTVEIDLASVDLHRLHEGEERIGGLDEWIPVGIFHLSAAYVVAGEEQPLASAGLHRVMGALETGTPTGLRIHMEKAEGPGVVPRIAKIAVVLANDGSVPLRVPANLTYPRHVFFSITRPGGAKDAHSAVSHTASSDPWGLVRADQPGSRASIDRSMVWDGDRWEVARPLDEQTFVDLAPGSSIRRVFDLAALVDSPDGLSDGAWEVRAWWRNRASGRRLGLTPPLATGLVVSEPLTIPIR
jgi:hypothetical protein